VATHLTEWKLRFSQCPSKESLEFLETSWATLWKDSQIRFCRKVNPEPLVWPSTQFLSSSTQWRIKFLRLYYFYSFWVSKIYVEGLQESPLANRLKKTDFWVNTLSVSSSPSLKFDLSFSFLSFLLFRVLSYPISSAIRSGSTFIFFRSSDVSSLYTTLNTLPVSA